VFLILAIFNAIYYVTILRNKGRNNPILSSVTIVSQFAKMYNVIYCLSLL
jgi:hypothetical protein